MGAENLPLPASYRRHLSPLHPGLKMAKLGGVWAAAILLSAPVVAWYVHGLPDDTHSQCDRSTPPAVFTLIVTSLALPALLTAIILIIAALKVKVKDRRNAHGTRAKGEKRSHASPSVASCSKQQITPLLATVTAPDDDDDPDPVPVPVPQDDGDQQTICGSRHASVTSRDRPPPPAHLTAEALELLKQLQAANGGGEGGEGGSKGGSLKRKSSTRRSGKLETGSSGGGIERHPSVRYSVRSGAMRPSGGMTQSTSTAFPSGSLGSPGHRVSSTERPTLKKRDSRTSRNSLSVEDFDDEMRHPPVSLPLNHVTVDTEDDWSRQRTASMGTESNNPITVGLQTTKVKVRGMVSNEGGACNNRTSMDSVRSTESKKKVDDSTSVISVHKDQQKLDNVTGENDDEKAVVERKGITTVIITADTSQSNTSHLTPGTSSKTVAVVRPCIAVAGRVTNSEGNSSKLHAGCLVPRGPCADTVQPLLDGYDPSAVPWSCWSVPIDDTSVEVVTLTLGLTLIFICPFYAVLLACTFHEGETYHLETTAAVTEWLSYAASLVHPVVQMTSYALKIRRVRRLRQAHVIMQRKSTIRRNKPQPV